MGVYKRFTEGKDRRRKRPIGPQYGRKRSKRKTSLGKVGELLKLKRYGLT